MWCNPCNETPQGCARGVLIWLHNGGSCGGKKFSYIPPDGTDEANEAEVGYIPVFQDWCWKHVKLEDVLGWGGGDWSWNGNYTGNATISGTLTVWGVVVNGNSAFNGTVNFSWATVIWLPPQLTYVQAWVWVTVTGDGTSTNPYIISVTWVDPGEPDGWLVQSWGTTFNYQVGTTATSFYNMFQIDDFVFITFCDNGPSVGAQILNVNSATFNITTWSAIQSCTTSAVQQLAENRFLACYDVLSWSDFRARCKIIEVNTSSWTITDVGSEYALPTNVRFNNWNSPINENIVNINTNKYITMLSENGGTDTEFTVMQITTGNAFSVVTSVTVDYSYIMGNPSITKIDDSLYVAFFSVGTYDVGLVAIEVNTSTYAITVGTRFSHDFGGFERTCWMVLIDPNHVAVFWVPDTGALANQTIWRIFEVNTTTNAISNAGDLFVVYTWWYDVHATYIDAENILVVDRDTASPYYGRATVIEVNTSTWDMVTNSTFVYSTTLASFNKVLHMDAEQFIVWYSSGNQWVYAKVLALVPDYA